MRPRAGMVLVVALVILVPLTLIAVVVMQAASMDLRMAQAVASRQQAEHQLEGVINDALQQAGLSSLIATMGASAALMVSGNATSATVELTLRAETLCRRRLDASSQNAFPACRYVEMRASMPYGKDDSPLQWIAGLEQPLLQGE